MSEQSSSDGSAKEQAKMLAGLDVWLLPQPKTASATGSDFDLRRCKGVRYIGVSNKTGNWVKDLPAQLKLRSGVAVRSSSATMGAGCIVLGLVPGGEPDPALPGIAADELMSLGKQGYVLHIDQDGVTAAATDPAGLYYATRTLLQIATDHQVLPGLHIRDWPSLTYRGINYDITRGQMPTVKTLKRLMDVAADAKINLCELYIEDVFKWESHPDASAPEALSPAEAHELFEYAKQQYMELHPLMQVLGHFEKIGSKKPEYEDLMVPMPPKGTDGHPWTMTVDVRRPESVAFVDDLVGEVCRAFPGKFLNVDVTEIADYGFISSGTKAEDLPELMLQYVLKLRDMTKRYGTRLMLAQCSLDSTGFLNGLGPVLDKMPKDVVIASYYMAEFSGGWEKDYPRLRKSGLDFFANSWIDSHAHIMPYVGHSADFSDVTVRRGLANGALGSVTCDWGDDGHYHLPAMTWYPFLYHGASAWTGANLDRDYFNQAFSRLVFGVKDDAVSRAICLLGNINGQPVRLRNAAGGIDEPPYLANGRWGRFYIELYGDAFTDSRITQIADPGRMGQDILKSADKAALVLGAASKQVTRNQDIIGQLIFSAENYQAMGRKLIMLANYLDKDISRADVAVELDELAGTYERLRGEFARLWLAECKEAGTFHQYVQRFADNIASFRRKSQEIQ